MTGELITGGCLCGALRYEARGAPDAAGYCYCRDCRKASGSAFIGFMGFAPERIAVTGVTRRQHSPAVNGKTAVRHFCPVCGGLEFGAGTHHGGGTDVARYRAHPTHLQPLMQVSC